MKLSHWIHAVRQQSPTAAQRVGAELRLRVKNLTRQTVLAGSLEVADSGAKRSRGLLGRQGLVPGGGLWIVPCESVHTIGMQFPIDLVYMDRKLRVRKTRSNVVPWRLSVCLTAHSILELPAGTIRKTETSSGDLLEFSPAFPNKVDDTCSTTEGPGTFGATL